jgi:hypothetical protein
MLKAMIQRLLRIRRAIRLKSDLRRIQRYWASKASGKGLLIEKDLERYLRRN